MNHPLLPRVRRWMQQPQAASARKAQPSLSEQAPLHSCPRDLLLQRATVDGWQPLAADVYRPCSGGGWQEAGPLPYVSVQLLSLPTQLYLRQLPPADSNGAEGPLQPLGGLAMAQLLLDWQAKQTLIEACESPTLPRPRSRSLRRDLPRQAGQVGNCLALGVIPR
jgi:hypothetical protein